MKLGDFTDVNLYSMILKIYNVRVRILILLLRILFLTILLYECRVYKLSFFQAFCLALTKRRVSENSLKNVIKIFLKEEILTLFYQGHCQINKIDKFQVNKFLIYRFRNINDLE